MKIHINYFIIDYCSKDDKYRLEYNNIYYKSCPNGTCKSQTNVFLCEFNYGQFDNECHRICDISDLFNCFIFNWNNQNYPYI